MTITLAPDGSTLIDMSNCVVFKVGNDACIRINSDVNVTLVGGSYMMRPELPRTWWQRMKYALHIARWLREKINDVDRKRLRT